MIYPAQKPDKVRFATVGRLGVDATHEIPQLRPVSLRFFPEADESEWIVLVHVSNFHYGRGGLWTAPLLSEGSAAEGRIVGDREFLIFCLGMIIVIGVYNIVLFIRRPVDKPTLMLALFCLVVGCRSAASDNLISWYFPQLDTRIYQTKYFIEYMTMVLGPLSCISFIHMSFISSSMPRFYRFIVSLSLCTGLFILTLDTYYCSIILSQIQVVTVLQIVFGLSVLVRAVIHKRDESILAAIGSFILSACVLYDILVTFHVFSQPYVSSLGMGAFVFMQGQVVAQRFAKAFGVAEHLSYKLKDEVELQTLELRSIMENIPQGVFIMLADQSIQGNYSKELEQLLAEGQLTGKKALPVLFRNTTLTGEDLSIIDSILVSAFHEPIFVWELNAHSLPQEFMRVEIDGSQQVFAVEWHPIVNRQGLMDRVLVTLRNVTEIRALQASQRKDQQAFTLLLEIVQISPDRFRDFVVQSHEILKQANIDSAAVTAEWALLLRKFLMRLHTWKGLSRSLGLKILAAHIHEVEQSLIRLSVDGIENLHDQLNSLAEQLRAYEAIEKERLGRTDSSRSVANATSETRQLLQAWHRFHYQPLEAYRVALHQALAVYIQTLPDITTGQLVQNLQQEVSRLARELDRPPAVLEGQGALHQPLPESMFKNLSYILQHLIRNSMDHGLETASERLAQGKARAGHITIGFDVRD
ncbi:MAG: hypothetical protein M3Q07_18785, partial [Pseudobdellovibrionaceae bacterium]|nr:hypothetical protein [Pseudobdellovibrionaceae bacterium]